MANQSENRILPRESLKDSGLNGQPAAPFDANTRKIKGLTSVSQPKKSGWSL
jgi:hypothetical protein